MDVVLLSRLQFALTIMFHYLFPPLTIGLGVVLVFLEYRWLRTDDPIYHESRPILDQDVRHQLRSGSGDGHRDGIRVRHELGRLFAVRGRRLRFGAGGRRHLRLLPGIRVPGRVALRLGQGVARFPLLRHVHGGAGKHLFLGLDCGRQLVAADARGVSSCRAGDQRTRFPAGRDRRLLGHGIQSVHDSSTGPRLVGGVYSGGVFRDEHLGLVLAQGAASRVRHAFLHRRPAAWASSPRSGNWCPATSIPKWWRHEQPAKLAAFEGHFETGETGNATLSFGWPDDETAEQSKAGVAIPGMLSFLVYRDFDQPVPGLDQLEADYGSPPVWLSFQTYHLMVGLGMLFIGSTLFAGWCWWRGTLFTKRWLLWYFVFAVMLAFVANEVGWVAAEVGRQPWIVYPTPDANGQLAGGLLTTDGVSEVVTGEMVLGSIVMFGFIYAPVVCPLGVSVGSRHSAWSGP